MTKADFLAGKPFKLGYSEYKFDNRDERSQINSGFVYENKFTSLGYEMWVEKIGEKGFSGYRYVMNKKVKLRINFDELREIEGLE